MTLPKWATTVTPFSKTFALIIFITFPILGFILGMRYQQISTLPQENISSIFPTPVISKILPTNSIIPTINLTNTIPLTFGSSQNEQVVRLEQKVISYNSSNFLSLSSKAFDSRTTTTNQLYNVQSNWANTKFYDLNTDKYYVLQPGGQIEIGLISETDINKLLGETTSSDVPNSGTSTKTSCTRNVRTLGNMQVSAVTCKSTSYLVSDNNRIVNEDETTNCYVPISTDTYLAVKQIVKPVSTNIDMCKTLDSLGYQNVLVTKN